MRKSLFVAAAVGILAANVALAQNQNDEGLQVGDYAPAVEAGDDNRAWINVASPDERPSMPELRGLVVVLFFWVSWHEGGEMLLPVVNMLSHNEYGQRSNVYFIGVTDANRKVTQPLVEEAKIFFPIALESNSAREYGYANGFGFVVVDPTGKIAYKGSGQGDLGGMSSAVQQALQDTPAFKTHPEEAKFCYRALDEAQELIRERRFAKAYRKSEEALQRSVLGDRLKSRTVEMVDLIEQLGYEDLSEVEPLLERRKYDDAVKLLRGIVRRFRRLDCYKDAKAIYERMQEESPEFKDAAGRFDDDDAALRLYLEARDDLKRRRFGDSYDKLKKIATDYPKTEAAEYAEAMIERMKRNRDFWLLVLDHESEAECANLLAQGRTLKRQGRLADAEKAFRRVMVEFPNTKWAQEAVEELKSLR